MKTKRIALIAHDKKKSDILAWVLANQNVLKEFELVATGTTGKLIKLESGLPIEVVESGPHGGDLQIGSQMVEGKVDVLIFFWDPLEPQPHDPDVKALLRMAVLKNIPTACNRATADLFITSGLLNPQQNPKRVLQNLTIS
jgi:methylglyoxal synthase